jgi:asparagine synthase (glutamine-hydrolysing)
MCGIAGYIAPAGERASRDITERMCSALQHRGPDSDGFYLDGCVALGMRRLKVIDLETGDQPVSDERGDHWAVFNGEIYNFRELRNGLLDRGHNLVSRGDTETLVHLYEELGIRSLQHLRGMFAFALWDRRLQRLTLVRDRLGVKPLYYATLPGGGLVFGSEIKALLRHPDVPRTPDPRSVEALLAYRYVPEPLTGFASIHKLPAGCYLEWQAGQIEVTRYWELRPEALSAPRSDDEWASETLTRLREAVRLRLESDVPLGAFLSGGIDSSLVVALMSEQAGPAPVRTFSIGFPGSDDELATARQIANHLGTVHHEFNVEPSHVQDLLPELTWHFDEPFGDSSALPTYLVSRLARPFVTVALTGDGGDEAFGGYTVFQGEAFSQSYKRLPRLVRDTLLPAVVSAGTRLAPASLAPTAERSRRVIMDARLGVLDRTFQKLSYFDDAERRRLLGGHDDTSHTLLAAVDRRADTAASPLDRVGFLMSRFYLPNDMLTKVDRMSMAHGLEARGPFLDHELAAWAAGLPTHMKLRGRQTKFVLRQLAGRYLPPSVVQRPKRGFEVPLAAWFKRGFATYARGLLLEEGSAANRWFARDALERAVDPIVLARGGSRAAERLWILLSFECWHRMYFDNQFGKF